MKIRGKIYLIVGIMSLLAIAITGMSLLIVSEYNDKLHQFQNASERAFKGERLNRLVTGVVMAVLIHISEPTRQHLLSRMPSSA